METTDIERTATNPTPTTRDVPSRTLPKPTKKQAGKDQSIEEILSERYGVGVVRAPIEAVLWAAEQIEDRNAARAGLVQANKIRAKHGAPLVYAPFGHWAF